VQPAQRSNRLRSANAICQQISRVLALEGHTPELGKPGGTD
jgi:hypothetical protein